MLALVVPAIGYWRYHRRAAGGEEGEHRAKLVRYAGIVASQAALVAGLVLVLRRHGLGLADVGQRVESPWRVAIVMGTTVALYLALVVATVRRARLAEGALPPGLERARRLIPTRGDELAAFLGVSVVAGACEELLFRGFMAHFLGALLGGSLALGIVAAALLFGLAHAYQGRRGMVQTGFVGLAFGAVVLASGSLVPAQVLHAVVDAASGLIGYRLLVPGTRRP